MSIEPLLLYGTARGVGDSVPMSPPKPHPAISLGLQALLDWNNILRVKQNTLSYEDDDYFQSVGRELRVDPPTIFCRPCRDLLKSPPEPREKYGEKKRNWVSFHRNMFDLINCCHNPRGNCPLCQQFWKSIKHTTTGFRLLHRDLRLYPPEKGLKVCLEVSQYNVLEDGQVHKKDDFTLTLNIHLGDGTGFPVGVTSGYDDLGKHSGGPDDSFTSCANSDITFSHIQNWIRECREEHARCKINHDLYPSNPPARLICIESSGERFRLEEYRRPEGQEEAQNAPGECLRLPKYTALSYRWGTRASFMLRKHNLEDVREWLSVSLLPKTLRDACAITVRLHLRHIWIDRLCIIQDSEKDWECESSKMADVYRNAWCTISAAGSRDDNGGCYFHRNPLEIAPLKLASNPFVNGRLCLDRITCFHYFGNPMISDRLNDRAWTFQERTLSRRILHFAKDQVYWQCREGSACEIWPSFCTSVNTTRRFAISEIKHEYDALEQWTEIVQEYSSGKLSETKDKLPALSGMASEMQVASKDTYLAGLWREHFLFGLCWRVQSPHPERPKPYRAPSWSWASLDSVIHNPIVGSLSRCRSLRSMHGFHNGPSWYDIEFQEVAYIKNVQVEPSSGSNPYGQVDNGWIEISSHLFQVSIYLETIGSCQYPKVANPNGQPLKLVDFNAVTLDGHHILRSGGTVPIYFLALLYEKEDTGMATLYCLVLAPYIYRLCERPKSHASLRSSTTNTRYQRVGLAELHWEQDDCHNFLEQYARQTVVIL